MSPASPTSPTRHACATSWSGRWHSWSSASPSAPGSSSAANRQLAEATRDKTRFLAAASHDLLQPLHAARLFTAALSRDAEPEHADAGAAGRQRDRGGRRPDPRVARHQQAGCGRGGAQPRTGRARAVPDRSGRELRADGRGQGAGPAHRGACRAMSTPIRGCCARSCRTSCPTRCATRRTAAC